MVVQTDAAHVAAAGSPLLHALKDESPKALLVLALLSVQEALASIDKGAGQGADASRIYLAETALKSLRLQLAAAGVHPCADLTAQARRPSRY
jgi:hypothetical protein